MSLKETNTENCKTENCKNERRLVPGHRMLYLMIFVAALFVMTGTMSGNTVSAYTEDAQAQETQSQDTQTQETYPEEANSEDINTEDTNTEDTNTEDIKEDGNSNIIKVESEFEGQYDTQKASVEVKLKDPSKIKVEKKDYFKYLKKLSIGNGLYIPFRSEKDFTKMNEIATSEGRMANERAVQLKIAKKADRKKIAAAKEEAYALAVQKYDQIWNMPSEYCRVPKSTSGTTKTYMDYKTVTDQSTMQYALLNSDKAYTKDGFRMYDGYYCIALGSYYGREIGAKYYITLSNGKKLRCILGDQKQDGHTDKKKHMFAKKNMDIMEFIVDDIDLPGGDISAVPGFEGSIVSIRRIIEPEEPYDGTQGTENEF